MTDNNTLEVPAQMVKTPLDEAVIILTQARIDLEARGYSQEDMATAFMSVGIEALVQTRGAREASRELYLVTMNLAQQANAQEAQPKH